MGKSKHQSDNQIELRSVKVRNMLGEIPPSLVRWGIVVIVAIIVGLIVSAIFIPFPLGNIVSIG